MAHQINDSTCTIISLFLISWLIPSTYRNFRALAKYHVSANGLLVKNLELKFIRRFVVYLCDQSTCEYYVELRKLSKTVLDIPLSSGFHISLESPMMENVSKMLLLIWFLPV